MKKKKPKMPNENIFKCFATNEMRLEYKDNFKPLNCYRFRQEKDKKNGNQATQRNRF